MTPLWARMLVFKAVERGIISDTTGQYYDKLILENSFKETCILTDTTEYFGNISRDRLVLVKEEFTDMDEVLKKIGTDKSGQFNLSLYVQNCTSNNISILQGILNYELPGVPELILKHLKSRRQVMSEKALTAFYIHVINLREYLIANEKSSLYAELISLIREIQEEIKTQNKPNNTDPID